ncbi:MAG TPA: S-methyl-5-thioribose-1-phosphate isomerase [Gemmatimonadaceae bacterium]|nr:S-methyl-5-thioribose-1-phosphate isomerase [Gemmatimonadaceae bacterium]
MPVIQAVRWAPAGDAVRIVDQTCLPAHYVERDLRSLDDVCEAIATLRVRGAPAIGIAGAMGLVASLARHSTLGAAELAALARASAERIAAVRPTAVNLPWAMRRMLRRLDAVRGADAAALLDELRAEATAILDEDRVMCRRIGELGAELLADGARVLTHCNAGALATGGIGTALAPVYVAAERGMAVEVFADETRPLLQGSRLTAWELQRAGIPVTVLTDGMAASLMAAGRVDVVLVGADRIAANGDVANKVGTSMLAIAARHHGVPFYVAAPSSTLDAATPTGATIRIEQRGADEVTALHGVRTAPHGVAVYNPAFDVTPAGLVTGIVTDRGVFRAPFDFSHHRSGDDAPPRPSR